LLLGLRVGLISLARLTNKALPLGAVLRTFVQGNNVPATLEACVSLRCRHTKNSPIQKKCGGSSFRHPPFGVVLTFAVFGVIEIAPNRDISRLRQNRGLVQAGHRVTVAHAQGFGHAGMADGAADGV
jgi:hypothetical protein